MKRLPLVRLLAALGIVWVVTAVPCHAQGTSNDSSAPADGVNRSYASEPFWMEHGRLTFGFQMSFGLENNIPHDISHINMIFAEPQIGIIAWDSPYSRLPVRRFELISEGILGASSHPGGRLFGTALLLRFGFKPIGRVVPYFDAGSGPVHTTIDEHAPELTGHTQFLSQGGAGLQYFLKPQCALVFEYHYFHMSNAGLQAPNPGFNGNMVTIGFRWLRTPRLLAFRSLHRGRRRSTSTP
ncbi:MAG TPA: acyloxyacyl hydrolase [Pseudacidobacterium sp.]|nr:acyloxyacyl hydrolase [Pseudacidobacterium sp.]